MLHAVTSLMLYIWKKYLFSCSSAYSLTIAAEGKALVKTDIAVAIPVGHYGRVGALQQQMREGEAVLHATMSGVAALSFY